MLYFLKGIRFDVTSTLSGHVRLDIGFGCCGGLGVCRSRNLNLRDESSIN